MRYGREVEILEAERAAPAGADGGPQIELTWPGALDLLRTKNNTSHQAIVLRDYQLTAVSRVRAGYGSGRRRILLVMPTGAGKTVSFAYVIAGAVNRGRRILIVAHRIELLDQIAAAVERAGASYGVIAPGFAETDAPVQIASVATFVRRLDRWRNRFDFLVADEAHHAVSPSWARVLASQPAAHVLGVSATPERLDGRGLCEIFDDMVLGPSTAELIDAGWLSPFVCFGPAAAPDLSRARIRAGDFAVEDIRDAMNGVVIGSAVEEYKRRLLGTAAVVFCVDVAHSKAVAAAFVTAGVTARHVDGEMSAPERRAAIAGLASGEIRVLTNCGLISEGVDIPAIGAVILLRPTASLALFLQMFGRGLRLAPGKDRAVLLDFAGNCLRHGMPDAPRSWSLEAKPRRQRERALDGPPLRRCGSCGALNRPSTQQCVECIADLRTAKERREIEVRLREVERRQHDDMLAQMLPRERLAWAGADERRLRRVACVSGYSPGWVFHRLREMREIAGARR
jgi:DNA repair protein RadD